MIVGHGFLERQVLGPATATGAPEVRAVQMRRYRCRSCKAVIVVGPRDVVRRRVYGAGAIAAALEAYGRGETSAAVRRATSPSKVVGVAARDRWVTVTRWIDAAREGELFGVRGVGEMTRRRAAEQVALTLAARAGRALGAELASAAFAGATIAA